MAQFSQGLGFNLPNPFPGDVELFAHLFQGAGPAVLLGRWLGDKLMRGLQIEVSWISGLMLLVLAGLKLV